jgi:hypothetical protein
MIRSVGLSLLLYSVFVYASSLEQDLEGFDDTPLSQTEESSQYVDESSYTKDLMEGFDDEKSSSQSHASDTSEVEEVMEGFEDEPPIIQKNEEREKENSLFSGFTGKFTEQITYSLYNETPHDGISSVKSSLLLDYEHKFENGLRLKVNAKAYYDLMYSFFKSREEFTKQEKDTFESELELFDAYVEGKISDDLDYKIGRQVVVWGRSDTIRVTDILNPLDNRKPGMVDIEDLRLPVFMAKFDYFIGDWRVTPIAVLEQRFSKRPPFGSVFYPLPVASPKDEDYDDVTYAVSIGGEFTGWDVNFYAAKVRNDEGQLQLPAASKPYGVISHDKIEMYGTALNILTGSWLFKIEAAYFDDLKYFTTGDKTFSRTDLLLGFEYNGIADTAISYDFVTRNMGEYDERLITEAIPLRKHDYQHAFRISSDFMNATLTANYLISLYGEKLDEGGFQRAWIKYELGEGINLNAGVVDYIGGSLFFDTIKDNDMIFTDISYSF